MGSDIFLPGKLIQTSPALVLLVRLGEVCWGSGSSEASWDVVRLQGEPLYSWSFLVMQSLVRHRNKSWYFGRVGHLWGIIFYEPKTTVLLIYLNSRYYEQMSQLPLCAGKYGWNGMEQTQAELASPKCRSLNLPPSKYVTRNVSKVFQVAGGHPALTRGMAGSITKFLLPKQLSWAWREKDAWIFPR